MKGGFGRITVKEFIGLSQKCILSNKIDGKEFNTAKGVSIATDFNKFKNVLFGKKVIRQK